jgi:hypothetical protein
MIIFKSTQNLIQLNSKVKGISGGEGWGGVADAEEFQKFGTCSVSHGVQRGVRVCFAERKFF